MSDRRRRFRRVNSFHAIGRHNPLKTQQFLFGIGVFGNAKLDEFRKIYYRATADGNNDIGTKILQITGTRQNIANRRMLSNFVRHSDEPFSDRTP